MYISSIFTIAVRGTGAFFGILVTILSARALSIEEAGDFLFCLTIIQSLGGVLCLGTYTAAVKVSASSSELGWHETNKEISSYFYLLLGVYALIFAVYLVIYYWFLTDEITNTKIILTITGLMGFSLNTLFSSCWQGMRRTLFASVLQNTIVPLLYILGLVLLYLLDVRFNSTTLLAIYVTAILIVMFLAISSWYARAHSRLIFELSIDRVSIRRLVSFGLIVTMNITILWSSQYAVALHLGDEEFALFNAGQRLAMLIGIVFIAVNFVVSPHFAKARAEKDDDYLRVASKKGVQISFFLATPVLIFILLFPSIPLQLFGGAYVDGENILRVLAFCQYINIIAGPSSSLLTMTGHENDLKNILIAVGITACVSTFLLTWSFGINGALFSSLGTFFIQGVLVMFYVKKRLGFTPFLQMFQR